MLKRNIELENPRKILDAIPNHRTQIYPCESLQEGNFQYDYYLPEKRNALSYDGLEKLGRFD